jgi:antitoxin HicB
MDQYSLHVEWSEEDDCFFATCPEFPGFSAHGQTRAEALAEAEKGLELRIEAMKEEGVELPQPNEMEQYSGQTRLRMPRSLHAELSHEAAKQDVSLNSLMVSYLSRQLGRDDVEARVANMLDSVLKSIKDITRVKGAGNANILPEGEDHFHQDPTLRALKS